MITAALAEAGVPADVFIDNLSVVRGGRRAWADGVLARRQPAAWHAIQTQAQRIADATLHWCPSHGKNPDWEPATGFDAEEIRSLNDLADEQVSRERNRLWARGEVARVARQVQHDRARSALHRLHRGLQREFAEAGLAEPEGRSSSEGAAHSQSEVRPATGSGPGHPVTPILEPRQEEAPFRA